MKRYALSAVNLTGAMLVLAGVFVFANSFSGRAFSIGAIKIASSADLGFLLIVLGMILFGLSFVIGKFWRH
jgi:hypothetical protein